MGALEYPDLDMPDPEVAGVIEQVRQGRPFVPNLYRMLLHSPGIASGWVHLANEVRFATSVGDRTRELAILMVSHLTSCEYEWRHHRPLALAAGMSEEEIARVRRWPAADGWSSDDLDVLRCVAAVESAQEVPPDVLVRLRDRFGAQVIVQLAATIAYYGAVARFLLAFAIEMERRD